MRISKAFKRLARGEKGITGLETAIILIAFVVVAAVFAYTALSAGLFSTQQSSEAIYSGLEEAQSTLETRGSVLAIAGTAGGSGVGTVKQVTFTLSVPASGEPIDFIQPTADTTDDDGLADDGSSNVVVMSYVDEDQRVQDLYWTFSRLGDADADDLLESGEKFQITIGSATAGDSGGNLIDALTTSLTVDKTFSIEVKPPQGAVLVIERTTPAYIDSIVALNS